MTRTSVITVSVQLICIAVLMATGPVVPLATGPRIAAALGLLIILWAVAAMGLYNLRIGPDLAEHVRLATTGPYRWVRHPMYTGGMLITLAWLWDRFTLLRLVVAAVLIVDFFVKLKYEEQQLEERFPEHREQMKKTRRLVPFLY